MVADARSRSICTDSGTRCCAVATLCDSILLEVRLLVLAHLFLNKTFFFGLCLVKLLSARLLVLGSICFMLEISGSVVDGTSVVDISGGGLLGVESVARDSGC